MTKLRYLFCSFLIFAFSIIDGKVRNDDLPTTLEDQENCISALGSLTYYMQSELDRLEATEEKSPIVFTDEEIDTLWNKAAHFIYATEAPTERLIAFENSYKKFKESTENRGNGKEAVLLKETALLLSDLWKEAIEVEQKLYTYRTAVQKKIKNQDFQNNKVIPKKIKNKLRPFIISDTHPKKTTLDNLFLNSRVTVDEPTFLNAGFKIISKRPRSYVYVASHPMLKGYLVKAYMDTEMRLKQYVESWDWLTKRCIGANKIRKIIKRKKIKKFTVASKWIYPLPDNNLPPNDGRHTLHFAILLVEDMNLVSKKLNLHIWKTKIREDDLKDLYYIITRANGSSYRPDNIWYTKKKTFAFIDTEYPSLGPDYYSIRKYLSHDMKNYWDRLVKNGMR